MFFHRNTTLIYQFCFFIFSINSSCFVFAIFLLLELNVQFLMHFKVNEHVEGYEFISRDNSD